MKNTETLTCSACGIIYTGSALESQGYKAAQRHVLIDHACGCADDNAHQDCYLFDKPFQTITLSFRNGAAWDVSITIIPHLAPAKMPALGGGKPRMENNRNRIASYAAEYCKARGWKYLYEKESWNGGRAYFSVVGRNWPEVSLSEAACTS